MAKHHILQCTMYNIRCMTFFFLCRRTMISRRGVFDDNDVTTTTTMKMIRNKNVIHHINYIMENWNRHVFMKHIAFALTHNVAYLLNKFGNQFRPESDGVNPFGEWECVPSCGVGPVEHAKSHSFTQIFHFVCQTMIIYLNIYTNKNATKSTNKYALLFIVLHSQQ